MKKLLISIITLLLAVSLTACADERENGARRHGSSELSFNDGSPCIAYILHDSTYNKDYIVVRLYDNSVAITPRLK